MKWLYYSFFVFILLILTILQVSYFSAWGMWGSVMHPVLWSIIFISFYTRSHYLWLFVIAGGFFIDILSPNFGLNLLALSFVAISLKLVYRYWMPHRNLVSWLVAITVSLLSYLLAVTVLYKSLGVLWRWHDVADMTWERISVFAITNFVGLLILFGLYYLGKYLIYGRRN